jgi:hypothetical protein
MKLFTYRFQEDLLHAIVNHISEERNIIPFYFFCSQHLNLSLHNL